MNTQNKTKFHTKTGRKKGFTAKESDKFTLTINLSNDDDQTGTILTTTFKGNYNGLIHCFKSYLSFQYYNYFQNILVKHSSVKYKHLLFANYLFKATNKTILTRETKVKSSLLDKGVITAFMSNDSSVLSLAPHLHLFNKLTTLGKKNFINLLSDNLIEADDELREHIKANY